MHRIALVQSAPDGLEIAILRISGKERADLRKDALDFVKANHIFDKEVRSVQLGPEIPLPSDRAEPTNDWVALFFHRLSCTVVSLAVPEF